MVVAVAAAAAVVLVVVGGCGAVERKKKKVYCTRYIPIHTYISIVFLDRLNGPQERHDKMPTTSIRCGIRIMYKHHRALRRAREYGRK